MSHERVKNSRGKQGTRRKKGWREGRREERLEV